MRKNKVIVLELACIFCIIAVSALNVMKVSAQELEGNGLVINTVNGIDVVTEYDNQNGIEVGSYQYAENGNRIRKEAYGVEYLYTYNNDILSEEQFGGHIVKYLSQSNDGDIIYTGCEIDGTMYTYERDEKNYIVALMNCNNERVLSYQYDENGILVQENIEQQSEQTIGLNHIVAEDKYWDAETELYYYYKSYWNPKEKQFVSGNSKTVEEIISEFCISKNTRSNASDLYSQALLIKKNLLATNTYGKSLSYSANWYSGVSEVEIMARLIYGEANNTEAQIKGVSWVLACRKDAGFASSYYAVSTQSGQFSAIIGNSVNTTNARNPSITSARWDRATELACILYVSNTKATYATITGRPAGYVDQLYFLGKSYFDSKTRNVSNYAGGTGEYYINNTWKSIKNINYLGDSTGNVFFDYQ